MTRPIISFSYYGPEQRLDSLLLERAAEDLGLAGVTRSQLKRWIELGAVNIDGRPARKSGALVKSGAVVRVTPPEESLQGLPFEFPLEICFEDRDLVVINKPAGLSMHPGAGNKQRTLVNALIAHYGRGYFGLAERAGIVHRLDKDTTGLVVVAKDARVLNFLSQQFSKRSVKREYLALAMATPRGKSVFAANDTGKIVAPIGRHLSRRREMAVLAEGAKGLRAATTHWQRVDRFAYGYLLRLRLETGRTHQIRVHLTHAGAPVIGDPVYGDFSALPPKLQRAADHFGRQALHAETLGFVHPNGQELFFSVEPPDDFLELVEFFRRA